MDVNFCNVSVNLAKVRAIVTFTALLLLSACGEFGSEAEECWNPKLLRVRVGHTILDLPRGVDIESWDGKDPDGFLTLRFKDSVGNRRTCQRKDRVPLDYGQRARLVMRDRPAERDYILSELYDVSSPLNQSLFDFRRRMPSGFVNNPNYISDYRLANAVKFVGSDKDGKRLGVNSRIYVFVYDERQFQTDCEIWTDDPSGSSPRPAFPYRCSPRWSFLMGDLIVAIDAQARAVRQEDGQRLIAPPELWPTKWAAVLEEISTYRVNPQASGQP